MLSPRNGRWPWMASWRATQKAKISTAGVISPPSICSGAMYAGVPITAPGTVSVPASPSQDLSDTSSRGGASAVAAASPKSPTVTRPLRAMSTLSGLKSRWMMPASWAAARPAPAATKTSTIACHGRLVSASQRRRSLPSISSMAMNRREPTTPTSCTATTLGWLSLAIAWASRSRRWGPLVASVAATPVCSTLIATLRSRSGSWAM